MKRVRGGLVVGGIVMIVAALAGWYMLAGSHGKTPSVSRDISLKIGQADLHTRVVADEPEREKGLSGSDPLADDEAMLFVFETNAMWGIWMKDMAYPIDIAWLGQDKEVKHLVEHAQPSSYPTIFRPAEEVRYVLEMKAGTAKQKRITIGSRAEFRLP